MTEQSQAQTIGLPSMKTWEDYRAGCLSTFHGGYDDRGKLRTFHHGMETVFNLLEAEFPPAEQCQAAPDLLEACKQALDWLLIGAPHAYGKRRLLTEQLKAAIAKAEPKS